MYLCDDAGSTDDGKETISFGFDRERDSRESALQIGLVLFSRPKRIHVSLLNMMANEVINIVYVSDGYALVEDGSDQTVHRIMTQRVQIVLFLLQPKNS